MQVISNISKGLETISRELEAVPDWVYLSIAAISVILLCCYFFIIPILKLEDSQKVRYRKFGIYGLLFAYIGSILIITIFARRPSADYQIQMVPLNSILNFDHLNKEIIRDVCNLVLFIPVGMLYSWQNRGKKKLLKSIGVALILSLLIELSQLVGKFGTFDVDDLLFNTLGGVLGSFIVGFWRFTFRRKKAGLVLRTGMVFVGILIIGLGGVFGAYHFLRVSGERGLKENTSAARLTIESKDKDKAKENGDPDLVWYNGKAYRFNDQVRTIIWMGIDQKMDQDGRSKEKENESAQADSIFLMVLNEAKNKMKMVSISKDTITAIPVLDTKGKASGEEEGCLGQAYALGDGREESCQYMVDSVSKLFYGIPINGYVAFNMDFLAKANDAIGGVSVTVPEDLTKIDETLKKGAKVTLSGNLALNFIQWTDETLDNGSNLRNARQKLYLSNFFNQAVQAVKKDFSIPLTLYRDLSGEMVTNIGADNMTYLLTKVLNMSFDEDNMMMLKGKSKKKKGRNEVWVDDDALYELVLRTFFVEEKSEN